VDIDVVAPGRAGSGTREVRGIGVLGEPVAGGSAIAYRNQVFELVSGRDTVAAQFEAIAVATTVFVGRTLVEGPAVFDAHGRRPGVQIEAVVGVVPGAAPDEGIAGS